MRKIISSVLAFSMLFALVPGAASCGQRPGVIEIDKDKTQLFVMNYDGGFGSKWLDDVAAKFEKLHENDSYETGKKGVQIVPNKTKTQAADLETSIMGAEDEVYFTQNFTVLFDYIAKGYLLDITDAVTEKLPGENRSIADKMSENQRGFLCVDYQNTGNGKYYAVPHYSGWTGLIYDIDLFENQGLYLVSDGTYSIPGAFNEGKYLGGKALSNGPDGQPNTYDDGLPATYEEFFKLCDYMVKQKSITPFNWFGVGQDWYLVALMEALQADYEGVEQMTLNFTFDGTAKNLISVSADGQITKLPELEITADNGYELGGQAGLYYAMQFLEKMIHGKGYHNVSKTSSLTYTHLQAQSDFLYSSYKNNPIAMLLDGNWWENEASDTFRAMEKVGLGKSERRFGFLPYPKVSEANVGEKAVMLDLQPAYGVIAKATPEYKQELAKEFLQFCYSDENLAEFSVSTNAFRDLDYTLTAEQQAKLSGFGKYMYALKESKQVEVVYGMSDSIKFLDNQSTLSRILEKVYWNNTATYASEWIRNGISTNTLFKTAKEYRQSIWSTLN